MSVAKTSLHAGNTRRNVVATFVQQSITAVFDGPEEIVITTRKTKQGA